ncbi:phosphatidic acid phosphatase type 2/haloperoxidase [Lentinula edodes]|uniref:phosphatidic acid phosphatase type 2/haloperoxidase n=1 Tax=Lentinula edodes TaxID=5353 RepID=UPI001E8EB521|nr:phosphatidic acid phosphatase type 2/haloperoxidase [Lentinula edodes]KAH7879633.1 phosphatidic acid phosphatase type 2/haloperoxidase [Lentinula edodes]
MLLIGMASLIPYLQNLYPRLRVRKQAGGSQSSPESMLLPLLFTAVQSSFLLRACRTILIVVALFAHFYLNRLQQFPEFDLTDTSIQYSIKEVQTVSNGLLIAVLVIPYLSIVAGNLLFNFRDWWDLHASLLGLSISYSASGSFVQFVRVTAGRPRPDFIARCDPAAGSVNSAFFGLTNITICQSTDSAFIKDGMRSFFSGHAILSAAGLGFMSLYWGGKLHLFNQKAYTYKVWLVFSPLILSIWICLTRVADRRHHWNDVALGFFLGLLFTYIIYRQFYPSLGDPECDIPFRPRVMSAEPEDTRGGSTGLRLPTRRPGWMRLGGSANRGPEGELESLGFMTTPFDSRHDSRERRRELSSEPKNFNTSNNIVKSSFITLDESVRCL